MPEREEPKETRRTPSMNSLAYPSAESNSAAQTHQKPTGGEYRADIDGLRALAVLMVVAFHIGFHISRPAFEWLASHVSHTLASYLYSGPITGGFIGVDIFFVISGYLISGILLREQETNIFSIVRFYERRIRRILPALAAVLLFVFIIGYKALLPGDMQNLGKSILAATFSAANIYFWRTSGYFAGTALSKPLLHTWSLAVEEQFYLVFPVLLVLVHRFARKSLKLALVLLTVVSFAWSAFSVFHTPEAAFYLPQTRAWELLMGTLLAAGVIRPPESPGARNTASLAGLALVLFSGLVFTAGTRFPGASALVPCLGSALIIAAGMRGTSLVGRLLSSKPLVFFGLISYSLYLWHWPLLLMNRLEYFRAFHLSNRSLFLVILAVSTLSWRFIEQPFRSGPLRLPRTQLFASAAVAVLVLTGLSTWAVASHGITSRFSPALLRMADYAHSAHSQEAQWNKGCFVSEGEQFDTGKCLALSSDRPNYLLMGDSHAAHLWPGLSTVFPEIHFLQATASKCLPILSNRQSRAAICANIANTVFNRFLPAHHVDAVILSAAWWTEADLKDMGQTVAFLHAAKIPVYVIGPIKIYDQPLSVLLVKSALRDDPDFPSRHFLKPMPQYTDYDERLAQTALRNGSSRYISLRELLCATAPCVEYGAPGVPLQFDESHLTSAGSLAVAERLRQSHEFP